MSPWQPVFECSGRWSVPKNDRGDDGWDVMDAPKTQTPGSEDQTGPLSTPAAAKSLPARLRTVYARRVGSGRVGAGEQALMLSWAAFGATFGTTRAITHVLRRRNAISGGSGGIVIAGRHLHHYNLGIALLTAVGGIAVHGEEPRRQHPLTATAYGAGAGAALILDELALLTHLP